MIVCNDGWVSIGTAKRQAWQHPCGQFGLSSTSDPRERYTSYHPADQTPA